MSPAELHAKFFPPTRPIVRAVIPPKPSPPHLVPPSEDDVMASAFRSWSASKREAQRLAVLAIYDEGCRFGRQTPEGPPSEASANKIVELICLRFKISWAELVGRGRSKMIVSARRAASLAMRKELGMSYPAIGRKLHRDHSSIIGLLRQAEKTVTKPHLSQGEALDEESTKVFS